VSETAEPRNHIDDLAGAYALGALEPAEAAGVERHLHTCEPCARLVADIRGTVGLLAVSARPETPSPAVKVALFARVDHAQQAATAATGEAAQRRAARALRKVPPRPSSNPWVAPAATEPRGHRPLGLPRPSSRWAGLAGPLATIPLLLALAVVGGWGMRLQDQVASRDAEVRDLQLRASAMDAVLNGGSGETQEYELYSGPAAPDGEGRVLVDLDRGDASLTAWDLPDPGSNQGYFVYVEQGGTMTRVGQAYQTGEDGTWSARMDLRQPLGSYTSVHLKMTPLNVGGGDPGAASLVVDTGSRAFPLDNSDALVADIDVDPSVGSPAEETGGGAAQ